MKTLTLSTIFLVGLFGWKGDPDSLYDSYESGNQHKKATPDIEQFEEVVLERRGCEGKCPVYRVTIDAAGKVTYDGKRFVRVLGVATSVLSSDQVRELVSAINNADFFSLRGSYQSIRDGCPTYVIDAPSAVVSVSVGTLTKQIRHDHGCRELSRGKSLGRPYPTELTDLEARIDQIADTARWVGIEGTRLHRQDMVAVRVSPDLRPAIVGARAYFKLTPGADVSARPAEPPVHPVSAPR